MKARVIISRAALRDVDAILEYLISEAGKGVADKYRRALLRLFTLLGDQPELGSPRPKLGRGVRLGVVVPYIVLYQSGAENVTVLRVLHGRRRISPDMLKRTS